MKNLIEWFKDVTWWFYDYKDNCEVCHGEKGGTRGNENIIDGKVMCDYCHVLNDYCHDKEMK